MSSKNFNSFKDFQSDQIQTSSCKLFTAHYACSNSDLNLTLVTGTTNGFIFQIINLLIESCGVRLTCFDCKCLNGLAPSYLFHYFTTSSVSHSRNTRRSGDLSVPRCRLSAGQRGFYFRGAKRWSDVPKDLQYIKQGHPTRI